MKPPLHCLLILVVLIPVLSKASTSSSTHFASLIRPFYYNYTRLTYSEDEMLRSWFNFKNKVPRFTMYLEWLEFNSFRPQFKQYREGVGMVGIYYLAFFDFCVLLSSLLLFFKIYFFGKDTMVSLQKEVKGKLRTPELLVVPLILLAISSLMFYVGAILTTYGNLGLYLGVRKITDLIEYESKVLTESVAEIHEKLGYINSSWSTAGMSSSELSIDREYLTSKLEPHAQDIKRRVDSIAGPAMWFEVGRFTWVWLQIVLSVIIVIFALAGYMPFKYAGIVVAASMIVFGIYAEISALLAYSSSEILVITDVCEQSYKIFITDTPPQGETGIGYFLPPLTPDNTGILLLHLLKAGKAYDVVLKSFNTDLRSLNYREKPAELVSDVKNTINNDAYMYERNLQQKGNLIIALHEIIRLMQNIKNNRHLRRTSVDILEDLCITALPKCTYAYIGIGMLTFSTIFIVMVCMQLSKLRKVPKLEAAARKLGLYERLERKSTLLNQ